MISVFGQVTHKFNQELTGHAVPIYHKAHQTLVGDGRDHIDAVLFGWESDQRSFPLLGKAPGPIGIRLEAVLLPQ